MDKYRPAAVEVNVVRTTTMRSRGEVPGKKKKLSGRWRTIIVSPFIVGLHAPFGPRWLRMRLRRRTVQLPAEPHVVSCLGTPQREMLAAALIGSIKEKVLEVGSKREIVTRGSLSDLVDGHWIGDEVINAFLVVLQDWSFKKASTLRNGPLSTPSVCFPTFWYTRLTASYKGYNYDDIARWVKKIDVFGCRNLVIPINFPDYHWAMVNVQIGFRKIEYLDSLEDSRGKPALAVLDVVEKFMLDEEARRYPTRYQWRWRKVVRARGVPCQEDTNSCGVFVCCFADHLIRNAKGPIRFQQEDVRKMRTGIACSLLHHKYVP